MTLHFGKVTIFEFSITRDRFTQARTRSLDAALAYATAVAELEAQAPGCCSELAVF